MASKRKRKKQARAAAAASQIGNEPTTSVGKAITKAKKTKKVKVDKTKIISGFGKKPGATVIHAITTIHQSALCDVRLKDIPLDDNLTAKDVTCSSCKKYVVYKQLLELSAESESSAQSKASVQSESSVASKSVNVSKGVKKKKSAAKKPVPDKKAEVESGQEDEVIDGIMESLKGLMTHRLQKMEKRIMKKMEIFCQELVSERATFFIARKANNMYEIIHDPSRYVISDNITESDAEKLLQEYLAIETKWDGQSKPSPTWLSAIRKIHEKYFPKKMKDKGKRELKRRKPRPSLKRRKDRKPVERKIKRRHK